MTSIETYVNLMEEWFNWTIPKGSYNISIVASWFHSIPHLDIKLHQLNSTTFDPNDNEYLESLGILVALPGFWLILTLLFFLIFFLCRCCDANTKKKRKLTCCKLFLLLFALTSCATITVGMFGTWLSHSGMMKVQNSTQDLVFVINSVKNNSLRITDTLQNHIDADVEELQKLLDSPLVKDPSAKARLVEQLYSIKRNVTKGIKKADEINAKIKKLNYDHIPLTVKRIEQIRWPATFGLLGTLAFVCFILIWGILRHSRCVLILFSVLGLLSLVVCWVISSVYLGISVAGSDFCVDPQPYINKQFIGIIDENISKYYLECDKDTGNPFRKPVKEGSRALENAGTIIKEIEEICHNHCNIPDVRNHAQSIKRQLVNTNELINSIGALVNCERVHDDYMDSLSGSCKDVLEGVAFMLISAAASGLCFTLLVLCASHTWINIRKKRPTVADPTDETDPFLPPASSTSTTSSANSKRMRDPYGSGSSGRPRFSHTPPQTPHFPPPTSTPPSANGRSVNRDDQLAFLSPPPAYEQLGHSQHSHQAIGPHFVADTDLMMRATQATKF